MWTLYTTVGSDEEDMAHRGIRLSRYGFVVDGNWEITSIAEAAP